MSSVLTDLRSVPSIQFSPKIKVWVAVSSGIMLLVTADILHRAYGVLLKSISDIEGSHASSASFFLASISIVPIATLLYRKWTNDCSQTPDRRTVEQILVGAFTGLTFFGLFVLLIQFEDRQVQAEYFSRIALFSSFLREANIYELLVFSVAIHVLRPVFEELVFRGLIFQSVARKYGLIVGAFASSAAFATIHLGQVVSPIMMFLFGCISCLFLYFYRSLFASYSLHITYNSLITKFAFIRGA